MRKAFRHLVPPMEIEIKDMSGNGIITFDTDILLDIYQYSEKYAESFLNLLVIASRIWLAYQALKDLYQLKISTIMRRI